MPKAGRADDWKPSVIQLQRNAYRRSRTIRAVLIAAVSTVLVVGAVVLGIINTPGWTRFRETFLDVGYGREVFPKVLDGLWLNLLLAVICEACILIIAMIVALLRTLRGAAWFPLRALAIGYVDLFRGLPMILVLLILGFGMPSLQISWVPSSPLFWGCAALVLVYSAYVAEVLRAGIESVHPSQRAASRSLGLSHGKTMRYVVVPQALRRVFPPMLNDFVSLMKDTGLVSILGVVYDAVLNAQVETAQTYNYTPYVVAGLLFVVVTIPLTRVTDWVARRQGWVGSGGSV